MDHGRIAALRLDRATVEYALAEELRTVRGVAYAFTRSDLLSGRVPSTELGRKIARSFHPTRSGDVVIVQQQFWYLYHDPECCASMHGSPYSYDTFVPVIFYGPGVPARSIARPIEPASIAPTLATLLNIKPPSGSVVQVTSSDALAYATWAGRELPTEEQYEYAARGGLDGKTYAWGDVLTPRGKWMANVWQGEFPTQDSSEDGHRGLAPVSCFAPNRYGLYDMVGNVWKWTSTPRSSAQGSSTPASRVERVIKGGSFMCSSS